MKKKAEKEEMPKLMVESQEAQEIEINYVYNVNVIFVVHKGIQYQLHCPINIDLAEIMKAIEFFMEETKLNFALMSLEDLNQMKFTCDNLDYIFFSPKGSTAEKIFNALLYLFQIIKDKKIEIELAEKKSANIE